ncbi:MAG: hypothetical protein ACK518_03085 [bacterium]|jgi:uncharacterized membrane protein
MKKLARFAILFIAFVGLFIIAFATIPSIVWIFGGSFKDVAHNEYYIMFGGLLIFAMIATVFSECFNSDFFSKD